MSNNILECDNVAFILANLAFKHSSMVFEGCTKTCADKTLSSGKVGKSFGFLNVQRLA